MTSNPNLDPAMADVIRRALPERTVIEAPTCELALANQQLIEHLAKTTVTKKEFKAKLGEGRSPAQIAIALDTLTKRVDDLDYLVEVVRDLEGELSEIASRRNFLYHFKIAPELGWAVAVAVGAVLMQGMTDVEKVTDIRTWIVGIGAGLVRAVIGAVMAYRAGTVTK